MVGLVLKLAPKERVIINGSVLENDLRRSQFSIVTPSANVLRLKEAIHPEDATTPTMRLCYQLQLILAGRIAYLDAAKHIDCQFTNLADIFEESYCQQQLDTARKAVAEGRYYSALKLLKLIVPIEERLRSRLGAKV
ncbi:flagellar biosynthesis repressor FlbT [Planktotalea sp.]|uniref:flagellar biosynthesis repressor FlbT n=1 Tax=Planktotalea sp. TaxID=2029877 RepID=UPI003F6CEAAC